MRNAVMHSGWLVAMAACSGPGAAPTTPAPTNPLARTAPADARPGRTSIEYVIDGRSVDRASWEAFVSTTTERPNTWYCDEMDDGGATGWEATDADGKRYRVEQESSEHQSTNTITSLPPAEP